MHRPSCGSWTKPARIVTDGHWLWRVTWHDGVGYGVSYLRRAPTGTESEWDLHLFRTSDGLKWDFVTKLPVEGKPNETTLRFKPNGDMVAMVRREAGGAMGFIGESAPPYTQWKWKESNYRLGGPNFIKVRPL